MGIRVNMAKIAYIAKNLIPWGMSIKDQRNFGDFGDHHKPDGEPDDEPCSLLAPLRHSLDLGHRP